ncbi:hypothetical protein JVT61DRAFT_14253 [Boletus reticuloceps]|uniref:Uncharacterized protein n=1 Tax=Boletus reticuloceps TaxID=495285 RepID=A0A8I2YCV5_9AGAM|nr:hypothetical protein JVT61DRAFT_14253 [Boletus reticuloceps]
MEIDPDLQGSVESSHDPIPTVVAGPSGIRPSLYAASNTSASTSTTSFGIRDPWRVTPDFAPSVGSSSGRSVHRSDTWYPAVPSESRKFEILYIPDPSRAMMKKEAALNLGWTNRDITPAHFESIKHLTGLVYKTGRTKDRVKVLVTEWLWILLQMDLFENSEAFDVRFMQWQDFRAIILDPTNDIEGWNMLAKVDCIIGGIDYSVDHSGEGNSYHLNMDELARYESCVAQLASQTLFWPPIRLARQASMKWNTICHLQMIARLHGSYTPRTVRLSTGQDIPDDVVLKRSHSECAKHVILPTASRSRRTWEYLNAHTDKYEFWMAQEYVQSLDQIGEWRVFIVGGNVISVVHTYKTSDDGWKGTVTESFLTLDEIREIVEKEPTPIRPADLRRKIVNPESGAAPIRSRARDDFMGFVLTTWKHLVARETRDTGAKPSICLFCRVDVGIRIDMSGQAPPAYFVNEVERSPNTSIWLRFHDNTMGTLADTFAMVFKRWLMDIRNPYIL